MSASRLLAGSLVVLSGVLSTSVAHPAGLPIGPTKSVQVTEGDGRGALLLVTFAVPRAATTRPGSGAYALTLAAVGSRPRRWYQIEVDPAVASGCRADAARRVPPYGRIAATFAGNVLYAVFHRPLEGAMLFFPAAGSCVEFSLDYREGTSVNEPELLSFARWFAGTVHARRLG